MKFSRENWQELQPSWVVNFEPCGTNGVRMNLGYNNQQHWWKYVCSPHT